MDHRGRVFLLYALPPECGPSLSVHPYGSSRFPACHAGPGRLKDAAARDTIVQHYLTQANGIQPGGNVAGAPAPDVEAVRITVEIRAPAHDIAGPDGALDGNYRVLYETRRSLPPLPAGPTPSDPGLTIDIAYVDAPSIVDWAPSGWPRTGPLVIPRVRDVQVKFEPTLRNEAGYFGTASSRGLTTTIALRAEARSEPALLIGGEAGDEPVRGFLFRRPPGVAAPPVAAQFAPPPTRPQCSTAGRWSHRSTFPKRPCASSFTHRLLKPNG